MAIEVEISCIVKGNGHQPHERITHVGGVRTDGVRWLLTVAKAIDGIEDGTWKFFVGRGVHKVYVIVAWRNGHKYLKTTADSEQPNNLLSLDECY